MFCACFLFACILLCDNQQTNKPTVLDVLTDYVLNNVRRIGESDYKPTPKDNEMINRYYPENLMLKPKKIALLRLYNCELNPSKWSRFNEISDVFFMIDLTSYHRSAINPNTNNKINEMQLTLNNFEKICKIEYV